MSAIGKNMFDVRLSNRVAMLNLLYTKGGLSRKEIAARLSLTPPAISRIASDMIEEGILVETKKVEGSNRMGRREILLEIDAARRKVLCAYIPTRGVKISCIDLAGNIDFHKGLNFETALSGEEMPHAICDEMLACLWSLEEDRRTRVIGVGLGIKGIYDDERGVSVKSFGLWEEHLPVREIMKARLCLKAMESNNGFPFESTKFGSLLRSKIAKVSRGYGPDQH